MSARKLLNYIFSQMSACRVQFAMRMNSRTKNLGDSSTEAHDDKMSNTIILFQDRSIYVIDSQKNQGTFSLFQFI